MKELTLRSRSVQGLCIQILDDKFAMLHDEDDKSDNGLITDNENYAIEIYKLLRKAFELGAFEIKEFDPEEGKEILV